MGMSTRYSPMVTIQPEHGAPHAGWLATYELRKTVSVPEKATPQWSYVAEWTCHGRTASEAFENLKSALGGRIPRTEKECPLL
jgi:hypothetical protein